MAITPEMIKEAEKLHLEALQIVRDLCNIPAPSHHEEKRAEYGIFTGTSPEIFKYSRGMTEFVHFYIV